MELEVKESVKLSLFYFFTYSAIASWLAFFNIHLESLGFSGLRIGSVNSIFIMVSAFMVPFWGMIADLKGSYRILLILTTFCGFLIFALSFSESYVSVLLFVLAISLFQQPVGTLIDGIVISLSKSGANITYGKLRYWGSVGYGLTSLGVGFIARHNTLLIFYISSVIFILFSLVNLVNMPPKPVIGRGLVTYKSLEVFFRNSKVYIFLLLMFMYGASIAPLHNFINLYYTEIGASNTIVGIALFVQAVCEIPFFLYGAKMVRKTSPEFTIMIAMMVSMLRMVFYGFISNPYIAIFNGLFHGFTISFFLVGAVEYVQSHTPSHLRTTGQSLVWAFHFGAGLTIGYFLTGILHDVIGMRNTMHVNALISLFVLAGTYYFFFSQETSGLKFFLIRNRIRSGDR
jgi:PPP family 3-phenylpropionic acid transporter